MKIYMYMIIDISDFSKYEPEAIMDTLEEAKNYMSKLYSDLDENQKLKEYDLDKGILDYDDYDISEDDPDPVPFSFRIVKVEPI